MRLLDASPRPKIRGSPQFHIYEFQVATNFHRRTYPWECGRPVPHKPHELGTPEQLGGSFPELVEAKTESFFASLGEPQCGHLVPFQSVERINSSLSRSHSSRSEER